MYLHSSNEEYSNVPTKQWQVQQCTNTAVTRLFCWYFEPSQPQRITSGLKQTSICLPIYYAHKSSNHKFSKNHKISPGTNLHNPKTCNRNRKLHQNCWQLYPDTVEIGDCLKGPYYEWTDLKNNNNKQKKPNKWMILILLWLTELFLRCLHRKKIKRMDVGVQFVLADQCSVRKTVTITF